MFAEKIAVKKKGRRTATGKRGAVRSLWPTGEVVPCWREEGIVMKDAGASNTDREEFAGVDTVSNIRSWTHVEPGVGTSRDIRL